MSRKCFGILGGGQLARMSAYQAYKLGFDVAIIEKEKNSPAGQLTKNEFIGWVDDKNILKKFAAKSDMISLENEFVDYLHLEFLENLGKKVTPSSLTISLIQDKLIQKETLRKNKIPVPKFYTADESSYKELKNKLASKFLLKSRKMGYDGYGNHTVKDEISYKEGLKKLSSRHSRLMAEEFITFKKELAVMVVRTKKEIKVYPVVETIQKNHICHTVIAPAQLNINLQKEAKETAISAVEAVKGFGIFGIELFLTEDEKILVNEMAPRPHNSGHYTIEACITSQFENHVRSSFELPLGSTELIKPFAVMINLLGKKEGEGNIDNYPQSLKDDEVHLHVYGKAKSRIGRKMGHLTLLGNNLEDVLKRAKSIEKIVSI